MLKLLIILLISTNLYSCGCHDASSANDYSDAFEKLVDATDKSVALVFSTLHYFIKQSANNASIDRESYIVIKESNNNINYNLQVIASEMEKQKKLFF